MKILVFIKEVPDIRIPVEYDEPARKVRPDWNVWILNPADRSAIEMALKIKEADKDTEITLVHLGPAGGERWIREGLAMGCDKGVRIFDEGLDQIGPRGKALIFSRIARILGFDLIMTGTRSQDTGNGQVGVLIASDLGVPYAGSVVGLEMGVRERAAVVTRRLAQGYHERIETPFPLVAAMEAYEESSRSAALPALLDATEKEIERLDLAAIGIPQALIRQKESILSRPRSGSRRRGLNISQPLTRRSPPS